MFFRISIFGNMCLKFISMVWVGQNHIRLTTGCLKNEFEAYCNFYFKNSNILQYLLKYVHLFGIQEFSYTLNEKHPNTCRKYRTQLLVHYDYYLLYYILQIIYVVYLFTTGIYQCKYVKVQVIPNRNDEAKLFKVISHTTLYEKRYPL